MRLTIWNNGRKEEVEPELEPEEIPEALAAKQRMEDHLAAQQKKKLRRPIYPFFS